MMYALNLGVNGRILSVTFDQYAPPNQPRVNELPEGDVSEYRYVNGAFVYDPIPVPPEPTPEPTAEDLLNILLGVEDVE